MPNGHNNNERFGATPGRPRSEQSKTAVLRTTSRLLREVGLSAMTTEQIAAQSGTSKATIYKWWHNKFAVAVEAFLSELHTESADPDTGSAVRDFELVLRGVMRFYDSDGGRVFAELVGQAQSNPVIEVELREHLIQSRRDVGRKIWSRGVERGELRADVDVEIALDLIFGPAMYRLVASHDPLDDATADAVIAAVMRGLAR
jgi:AcrR family transcriptional regulator